MDFHYSYPQQTRMVCFSNVNIQLTNMEKSIDYNNLLPGDVIYHAVAGSIVCRMRRPARAGERVDFLIQFSFSDFGVLDEKA